MATDATTLLIQRISSQSGQGATSAQNSITSVLSQVNIVIGNAASYAQLLSTAEGPIASAAANAYVASVAADATAGYSGDSLAAAVAAGTAEGGAVAAGAGVATAGIGAAFVLIVSFIAALLSGGSSDSTNTETDQLNELHNDLANLSEAIYWQAKIGDIMNVWNSPTGGLGTDLFNLAYEGIGPHATDVHTDVTKFHDNVSAFVNNFFPEFTPGAQQIYWQRPIDSSQIFSFVGAVGWFGNDGNPPQPQAASAPLGDSAQWVLDPRSAMPYLLLGIKCFLRIEALLNLIDKSQPTFQEFLSQFQGALQSYAGFIYRQYQIAVNGIVKTDLPSTDDVLALFWGTLEFIQSSFPNDTGFSLEQDNGWLGQYGALDQYPLYGVYQPSTQVVLRYIPYAAPSYIVSEINTSALSALSISDIDPLGSLMTDYGPQQAAVLQNVVVPWVKGKIILGTMARWKAIYLLNGYDQLWSILQNLRRVAGQTALATPTLDQDGTIANGNWSARELYTLLNAIPNFATNFLPQNSDIGPGYSLTTLIQWLDGNALTSWGVGGASVGPLGFRDRLAAAAVRNEDMTS